MNKTFITIIILIYSQEVFINNYIFYIVPFNKFSSI